MIAIIASRRTSSKLSLVFDTMVSDLVLVNCAGKGCDAYISD